MYEAQEKVQSLFDTVIATRSERVRSVKSATVALDKISTELILSDKSVVVARTVYDSRVATFFCELESLVSAGLQKVFCRNYTFKMDYQASGTKFLLASDETGGEFTDILNSHGGGVVQVIAFILQIYAMQYAKSSKVFLFDEPFAMVSSGFFKERLSQLIIELCTQFDYQFIMVTHDTELLEYLIENPMVCNYPVELVNKETKISAA